MESNKSDIIVAKKGGVYGTDILDYSGFIISDPVDSIRNRSALSPVKSTEVYQKLKENQWLLRDTRYYVQGKDNSDFDFQIRFTEFDEENPKSGDIDTLDDSPLDIVHRGGFSVLSYIDEANIENINKARAYSLAMSLKDARNEMVDNLYNMVFGSEIGESGENTALPTTEKVFYDSSKTRVVLSGDSLIELIVPGSDMYTNKVSLGPLIKSNIFKPGMKCIIDLSINFSKEDRVYTRSAMFPVFTVTDAGIEKSQIDLEISNEIRVYFNRNTEILSISKIDQSIDEYIIEGCTARILL